jgi:hypothetical protein
MKITERDVRWLIDTCFSRHSSPEQFASSLPLDELVMVLLSVWEGQYGKFRRASDSGSVADSAVLEKIEAFLP